MNDDGTDFAPKRIKVNRATRVRYKDQLLSGSYTFANSPVTVRARFRFRNIDDEISLASALV